MFILVYLGIFNIMLRPVLWSRIRDPIAYDHGCVPIGRRDQWRHLASLGYDHGGRDRGCRSAMTIDHNPNYWVILQFTVINS